MFARARLHPLRSKYFSLSCTFNTTVAKQGINGSWSDRRAARCVPTPKAPTVAPTVDPDELVTCCMSADDGVLGIYVDGQRLRILDNPFGFTGSNRPPGRITFHSSAKVLGIWHSESD